jgi:5-oxopent-3-ene-1,2,5-tricarboxylate decarboxylase/2-hydroxyhepta-2,4-diene-1,7-dioate isomerase
MKRARIRHHGRVLDVVSTDAGLRAGEAILSEDAVLWEPPLRPGKIFAVGLNYADHARELSFNAPSEPLIFLKGPNTLTGHRRQTPRPRDAEFMHYECELVVVIGRRARNVARQDAYHYVGGYTVANDYAVRDYLENYYRPNFRVKSRDASTPLGPWLVDAADIADPMNLRLTTTVNGRVVQEGSTRDMIFDVAFLISHLSNFMTLEPGDLILTGTPEGAVNVTAGDVVVTEVEGVGRLENTLVDADEFHARLEQENRL